MGFGLIVHSFFRATYTIFGPFIKWVIPGLFFFIHVFSMQLAMGKPMFYLKICRLFGFEPQTFGVKATSSAN